MAFVTPEGMFHYLRMSFGLASVPSVFQRLMKEVLEDCPGAVAFQDDILIFGKDHSEHKNLENVLIVYKIKV